MEKGRYLQASHEKDGKMPTLKQAQADPKAMSQFIAEHDGLEVDGERFDAVMGSMIPKIRNRVTKAKKTDDSET